MPARQRTTRHLRVVFIVEHPLRSIARSIQVQGLEIEKQALRVDLRTELFDVLGAQSMRDFAENLAGSLGRRLTATAGNFGTLVDTAVWRIIPPVVNVVGAVIVFAWSIPRRTWRPHRVAVRDRRPWQARSCRLSDRRKGTGRPRSFNGSPKAALRAPSWASMAPHVPLQGPTSPPVSTCTIFTDRSAGSRPRPSRRLRFPGRRAGSRARSWPWACSRRGSARP